MQPLSATRKEWKTFGLILRADPEALVRLLDFIRASDDLYLVYYRSSVNKLILGEESY